MWLDRHVLELLQVLDPTTARGGRDASSVFQHCPGGRRPDIISAVKFDGISQAGSSRASPNSSRRTCRRSRIVWAMRTSERSASKSSSPVALLGSEADGSLAVMVNYLRACLSEKELSSPSEHVKLNRAPLRQLEQR